MADLKNFDEMFGTGEQRRESYRDYHQWLESQDSAWLHRKSDEAETVFRRIGITFSVYGEEEASERLIPFDVVPRIISSREWSRLVRGIRQRVQAMNAFLHDVYHRQEIIRAGRIPVELIVENDAFLPQMIGVSPPGNVYTHIVGVDIVRTGENEFHVLEDNARTPSGVSYMLENREIMLQMFPELFAQINVQAVGDYPKNLRRSLGNCAPRSCEGTPVLAVLTPGIYNSAYFSTRSLPPRWARSWSKVMICAWSMDASPCVPPKGTHPLTSFTDAWTTITLTRSTSIRSHSWGCRAFSTSTGPAGSPSAMPPARALPMIRPSIRICRTSSSSIRATRRC